MAEKCASRLSELALLGGETVIKADHSDIFKWPIVTDEHKDAVIKVLDDQEMSRFSITKDFEKEYSKRLSRKYALACNNGTAAVHSALFGMGIGIGDEIIGPSVPYWASVLPAYSLGATVVFADIDPFSLCLDPADVERRITERTKAVVVVHACGMPAEMDAISALAKKHKIMILEDCSHAHGAVYKGRQVGTIGNVSAFSLMSGKSLAIGEGGILLTDDQKIHERALLFGHYFRHNEIRDEQLKPYLGIACGGYKYRMGQVNSAFGLIQLKRYPEQMAEIDKAMNHYCDLIESLDGLTPQRPGPASRTTKGGWYYPIVHYNAEQFGGLSVNRFVDALCAEGSPCRAGFAKPLHTHPVFSTMDIYGHGKPTRVANLPAGTALDHLQGNLPVTEGINEKTFSVPWFKHFDIGIIEQHFEAVRKVVQNHRELLPDDEGSNSGAMGYSSTFSSR